jgi:predicted nucleotidyltransferase
VLKWPDRHTVDQELRRWIGDEAVKHSGLCRVGYFGSYARGDWGVGSDIDLIAIVSKSSEPFDRRNLSWDVSALPVAADLLVYTLEEWNKLERESGLFIRTLNREAVWIFER